MKLRPVFLMPLFLLAGCAHTPEERLAGIWSLEPGGYVLPAFPVPNAEDRFERLARNIRLKIHTDHRFVLLMNEPVEGKWALRGDKLTLTPDPGSQMRLMAGVDITVDPGEQRMTIRSDTPFGEFSMRLHKSG